MLKLISSRTSPFGRKTRIVLAEKKIEFQFVEESPFDERSSINGHNPLGKVPILLLEDGSSVFDSRVIVEYLDAVSPVARLIPEPPRQRIAVRKMEALADGICDAAVGIVMERQRPAGEKSEAWMARQRGKMQRGVDALARDLGERNALCGDTFSLADIAAGCALLYLDFRHPDLDWRGDHPNLARYADRLARRTSFVDSAPPT